MYIQGIIVECRGRWPHQGRQQGPTHDMELTKNWPLKKNPIGLGLFWTFFFPFPVPFLIPVAASSCYYLLGELLYKQQLDACFASTIFFLTLMLLLAGACVPTSCFRIDLISSVQIQAIDNDWNLHVGLTVSFTLHISISSVPF